MRRRSVRLGNGPEPHKRVTIAPSKLEARVQRLRDDAEVLLAVMREQFGDNDTRTTRAGAGPQYAFSKACGIYRSDVAKVKVKTKPWGQDRAASRRSAPSPGKRTRREGRALLIVRDEFRPAIP